MKRIILSMLAVSSLVFTSCSDDDSSNPGEPIVTAPTTYVFEREGQTSVSFSGQTTRIKMAEEIIDALNDNSFTEVQIDGMYTNTGDNFSDPALNAETSKVVRKKTAASFDFFGGSSDVTITAEFDGWIADQVNDVYPNWGNTASAGVAGRIERSTPGSYRYVNAKGLELNQAFNKSLIGALMVDQMLNNYISSNVLDGFEAENDSETLVSGKNYTDMEHDWDEAYGYLFGGADPTNFATPLNEIGDGLGGSDSFLNKYLDRVNDDVDFNGIAQDIYDALKLGRAAIVAKNYTVRNQQAEIIREKVSTVVGVRSVYYLQQAKNILEAPGTTDFAAAFHDLSEAFGFIYSLQFTRKPNSNDPYLTRAQVQSILGDIYTNKTNGFWDVTADELQTASETIAAEFDFTVEQAGS